MSIMIVGFSICIIFLSLAYNVHILVLSALTVSMRLRLMADSNWDEASVPAQTLAAHARNGLNPRGAERKDGNRLRKSYPVENRSASRLRFYAPVPILLMVETGPRRHRAGCHQVGTATGQKSVYPVCGHLYSVGSALRRTKTRRCPGATTEVSVAAVISGDPASLQFFKLIRKHRIKSYTPSIQSRYLLFRSLA